MMDGLAMEGGPATRTRDWPAQGPRFGEAERKHLEEALAQNTLFYAHGEKTKAMCERMKALSGAAHAVACNSGSSAIHGAVKACGVGPGDEVITSPITDAGTILGVVYEGAIPVFADIDPRTYSITAESIEARLTERTRAVIVVHLAGCPVDMRPILDLARLRGIRVIEDCAQSWGATIDGRWVGTFGDFGCFSLNDFKHISAGDGGLIITHDGERAREAALCIDKCYDRSGGERNRLLEFVAPNYRITELQSAVALGQLDKVESIAARRHALGRRLTEALEGEAGLIPHIGCPGSYETYWFYLLRMDPEVLGVDAETFMKAMNAEGIPGGAGYVEPLYLAYPYLRDQTAFHHSRWPFSGAARQPEYAEGACPNAEVLLKCCFRVPLGEWLEERDIDDVAAAARKVAATFRARVGEAVRA